MILARDPTCRDPFARHSGVAVQSLVADHIVTLRQGGTWAASNGQGLCESCHAAKRQQESEVAKGRSTGATASVGNAKKALGLFAGGIQ